MKANDSPSYIYVSVVVCSHPQSQCGDTMGTEEQMLQNDSNVDLGDIETDSNRSADGPLESTTLQSSLDDIRSLTALDIRSIFS